jgi:hypothetical protein
MDGLLHNILISIHALEGLVAFVTGIMAFNPPVLQYANRHKFFVVFLISLAFMLGALYLVVIVDWVQLDFIRQVAFSALCVLGVYMAFRAFRARQALQVKFDGWEPQYMDHVGFNLISLFEGFIIVLAIDLGMPGWLVGVIAISGLVLGITTVNKFKSRIKS